MFSDAQIGGILDSCEKKLRHGEYDESRRELYTLVEQHQQNPHVLKFLPTVYAMLAQTAFALNNFEDAIMHGYKSSEFSKSLHDAQGAAQALLTSYEVFRWNGDTASAIDVLKNVIAVLLASADPADHKAVRQFESQINIMTEGEPLCRMTVSVDGVTYELNQLSQLPELRNTRISFQFTRNRVAHPKSQLLCERGRALAQAGQFAESCAVFKQASEVDPYDPSPVYDQGLSELYLRDYQAAMTSFVKTNKLAPGWFHVRHNIWIASKMLKGELDENTFKILHVLEDGDLNPQQKVVVAQKVLENYPGFPIAHLHIGQAYQQLRRAEDAAQAFRAGLAQPECDPDVKARLLFALSATVEDAAAKMALLDECIALKGNLTTMAMAMVSKHMETARASQPQPQQQQQTHQ